MTAYSRWCGSADARLNHQHPMCLMVMSCMWLSTWTADGQALLANPLHPQRQHLRWHHPPCPPCLSQQVFGCNKKMSSVAVLDWTGVETMFNHVSGLANECRLAWARQQTGMAPVTQAQAVQVRSGRPHVESTCSTSQHMQSLPVAQHTQSLKRRPGCTAPEQPAPLCECQRALHAATHSLMLYVSPHKCKAAHSDPGSFLQGMAGPPGDAVSAPHRMPGPQQVYGAVPQQQQLMGLPSFLPQSLGPGAALQQQQLHQLLALNPRPSLGPFSVPPGGQQLEARRGQAPGPSQPGKQPGAGPSMTALWQDLGRVNLDMQGAPPLAPASDATQHQLGALQQPAGQEHSAPESSNSSGGQGQGPSALSAAANPFSAGQGQGSLALPHTVGAPSRRAPVVREQELPLVRRSLAQHPSGGPSSFDAAPGRAQESPSVGPAQQAPSRTSLPSSDAGGSLQQGMERAPGESNNVCVTRPPSVQPTMLSFFLGLQWLPDLDFQLSAGGVFFWQC